MKSYDPNLLDSTFRPLIYSAEDALRKDMKQYLEKFKDIVVHIISFGDFVRALQGGEDMITLGCLLTDTFIIERVIFNPFSQSLGVLRDSCVDPVLSATVRPFSLIER